MSGFTDFLLAAKKDAKAIARTDNPTSRWPGFDTKHVNQIDLQNLYEIITGTDVHLDFELLHCDESGEGPLVECIPNELIEALITLAPKAATQAAKKWVKSEEFRDLWEVPALEEMLGKLIDLAKRARTEKKQLLLCSSGA
jgi:hypothetical protein